MSNLSITVSVESGARDEAEQIAYDAGYDSLQQYVGAIGSGMAELPSDVSEEVEALVFDLLGQEDEPIDDDMEDTLRAIDDAVFGDDDVLDDDVSGLSIPASVKEAKQDIIDQTQMDPRKLRTLRLNWVEYMRAGVLPNIVSKRWRGRGKLTANDLGLDAVGSEKFKLGNKVLMPSILPSSRFYNEGRPRTYSAALDSYEKAARDRMRSLCVDTPFGQFMPVGNFHKWREIFSKYKEDAYELVAEMERDWPLIREAILAEYAEEAEEAYLRHRKLYGDGMSREIFIEDYMNQIDDSLPTAEDFVGKFVFDDEYDFIPLPTLMAEEMAEAQEIRENAEIEGELQSAEAERIRQERIALRRTNDAEEAEIDAMRKVVMDKARQDAESQADEFVDAILIQMRQKIAAVAEALNANVEKNGRLVGRSMSSLKSMMEWVRDVNLVVKDEQVAAMIDDLEASLNSQDSGGEGVLSVINRVAGWCEVQIAGIQRSGRIDDIADDVEPIDNASVRFGRSSYDDIVIDVVPAGDRRGRFSEIVA